MQTSPTGDAFRAFLQAELVRRIGANPRYSLRAFARTLRVDPSLLSKVLRGKRKVSRALFAQIADRLALPPEQRERLCGEDPFGGDGEGDARFIRMSEDGFRLIADWYHYAIYEMALLPRFRAEPRWIASALGISAAEAAVALARLERLGLFARDARRRLVRRQREGMTTTGTPDTAAAFRTLQRGILEGALRALEEVPIERRDQSSMTMPVDTRALAEAKDLIRKFRRKLCRLMESSGRYDQVYHLSVSLYPVTRF